MHMHMHMHMHISHVHVHIDITKVPSRIFLFGVEIVYKACDACDVPCH